MVVAALAAASAAAVGAPPPAAAPIRAVTVRVTAKDFAFVLSRRSVPRGTTVRFLVRNTGAAPHDFVIGGRRTRVLRPGGSQTLTVRFSEAGTVRFLCSVPGHVGLGMQGRFGVSRPAPPPSPPPPPPPPTTVAGTVRLTEIARFASVTHVSAPPEDVRRLFVVQQTGLIRVLVDGVPRSEPYLDISDRVLGGSSEPGLLSVAFPPNHATSGLAYVFYNARQGNGDIRISEFRQTPGDPNRLDPASERVLLEIRKPWENHNGGLLQFDRSGMLYASVGDGDSGVLNPPGAFAQRRDDLLGNILRIDPRGAPYAVPGDNPFVDEVGVRPEIWAYGLRNPWRFWLDEQTGRLFVGDVGLGAREEIDLVPAGRSGLNFGWPCLEGTLPFDTSATCVDSVGPIWESDRSDGGCSVILGVVARDPRLPALAGRLLYGDFCTGRLAALTVPADSVTADVELGLAVPRLSSFGTDGLGRIHVATIDGIVYRLDPA